MGKKIAKIYPWYYALEGDLLFYIAIDTLFLSIVKNLTEAEIVSLATVSTCSCIFLQFPILWLIKRIGNTLSVRIGAGFLLLSALTLTFGGNYIVIALGGVFRDIAAVFRNASVVALENCLDEENKRDQFVKIRTRGNTFYAIITMLISFVASFMFNFNNYLPMVCCILSCAIGFVLSFFVVDYTKYNRITVSESKKKVKVAFNGFVVLAILVFGLFYPIVTEGQSSGKLFIQINLLDNIDAENTAIIIGAIVCISRIVRVLSNLAFVKIYQRYYKKIGIFMVLLLFASIALQLFGSFIPPLAIRIAVMGLGYMIILFIRDPFKIYIQDILFDLTEKEAHQTLITFMEFAVKVGTTAITFVTAMMLLSMPMSAAFTFTLLVAFVEIILSVRLYVLIQKHEKNKAS